MSLRVWGWLVRHPRLLWAYLETTLAWWMCASTRWWKEVALDG